MASERASLRGWQGAVQRERHGLSPAHLDIRLFQRVRVPEGTPDYLLRPGEGPEVNRERDIWRLWHYVGGSHTWRLNHDTSHQPSEHTHRYANGRELVDLGAAIVIASNDNPGSAPSGSMPFAIALACRHGRLRPAEAITAATWNAACLLDLQDEVGSLEPGKRADIQLLEGRDERTLALETAGPGPIGVMLEGRWYETGWKTADPLGD